MHFVLDEKVDERDDSAEKGAGHVLAVLDGVGVVGAQGEAAKHPGDGGHKIRNHENVVPVVVVRRSDVGPAAAGESAEDTEKGDNLGKRATGLGREQVPETDEGETRARGEGNEEHKERALREAIANRGRDGREPFLRVAEPFVLDNLCVVEGDADEEGTKEGGWQEVSEELQGQEWNEASQDRKIARSRDSIVAKVSTYHRPHQCAASSPRRH